MCEGVGAVLMYRGKENKRGCLLASEKKKEIRQSKGRKLTEISWDLELWTTTGRMKRRGCLEWHACMQGRVMQGATSTTKAQKKHSDNEVTTIQFRQ